MDSKDEILKAIADLKADITSLEERLLRHINDVSEFNRAKSMNARMRQTEVNIGPTMDRLTAVESRLLDVERRVFFPNQ